eukprot:15613346-Heterocapsa_arctica.AAC.1
MLGSIQGHGEIPNSLPVLDLSFGLERCSGPGGCVRRGRNRLALRIGVVSPGFSLRTAGGSL